MKLSVCAIFDRKLSVLDQPFAIRHTGEAVRQFEQLKKQPDNKFSASPEDFVLMHVATYDDNLGTFENLSPQIQLTGV